MLSASLNKTISSFFLAGLCYVYKDSYAVMFRQDFQIFQLQCLGFRIRGLGLRLILGSGLGLAFRVLNINDDGMFGSLYVYYCHAFMDSIDFYTKF